MPGKCRKICIKEDEQSQQIEDAEFSAMHQDGGLAALQAGQ